MSDLITLEAALAWLGQTTDPNNLVSGVLDGVSAAIESWIGYSLNSASYSAVFNGDDSRILVIPNRPLTAVASVVIDGTATVPAQSLPSVSGFSFSDSCIYLSGRFRFCRGFQNVAVNYTAGYEEVPADIMQACLDWISVEMATQTTSDASVIEYKAGDTQIKRSLSASGVPTSVAAVLQPYRRVI